MNVVAQDYQDKNFSEMFIDCMVEIMFCMIWLYPKKASDNPAQIMKWQRTLTSAGVFLVDLQTLLPRGRTCA